jgi:hypothetical protein
MNPLSRAGSWNVLTGISIVSILASLVLLWKSPGFLGESVAHGRFAVHSEVMSISGNGGRYFWCLRHRRVEVGTDTCAARYVLGPYGSAADAEHALERVRERNEAWEAEDARWAGEDN